MTNKKCDSSCEKCGLSNDVCVKRTAVAQAGPLVLYHANCLDGFGAAYVAWQKFGDRAEYLPVQYKDATYKDGFISSGGRNAACSHREVYVLDFSFPRAVMELLMLHTNKLIWLDHHKTAFEDFLGKGEYLPGTRFHSTEYGGRGSTLLLDDNKSGAMLAWDHFFGDYGASTPLLYKHLDDYDRWKFKLQGTRELNAALRSYPMTFEMWDGFFGGVMVRGVDKLVAEGAHILRAHQQNVELVASSAKVVQIFENPESLAHEGLAVNCPPHLASDVGHELAKRSGTFSLLWHMSKGAGRYDMVSCSLRSNGDYDVSHIAKQFGGGGHKNAAGFEVGIFVLRERLVE